MADQPVRTSTTLLPHDLAGPVEDGGSGSLYSFVLNNPLDLLDPDGRLPAGSKSTPTCRFACGQCFNDCRYNEKAPAWQCEARLRWCYQGCDLRGAPSAACAPFMTGAPQPSPSLLLCCGTNRPIPVIDYGLAHDVTVIGCTVVSFAAPSGACCKIILADAKLLSAYRSGAVGCRLVRIRKWIRYDLPHHGKCAGWDGRIPNWWRGLWN